MIDIEIQKQQQKGKKDSYSSKIYFCFKIVAQRNFLPKYY